MEELVFTLKLQEVPVKITDEQGIEKTYTLKELTSDQRNIYLNQVGKVTKFGVKGAVEGMTNYKFLQENLLTKCLLDEDGKGITREVLCTYPSNVITKLFKAAQELSGMDLEGEEEAKND